MRWLLFILLAIGARAADIIPSTNRIDWASISGNESRPNRSTIFTTLSVGADTATTQAAIDACPSNQVVIAPAGSYTWGALAFKSYMTLRGEGDNTLVSQTATWTIGAFGFGRTVMDISSGANNGSTSIVLSGTPTTMQVGQSISITETNDVNFVHPYGYEENATAPLLCTYCDERGGETCLGCRVRGQIVRVTDVSGSTVTFAPALYGLAYTQTPRSEWIASGKDNMVFYLGIENLKITRSGNFYGMDVQGTQNCWVSNVWYVAGGDSQMIRLYYSHRLYVQHSRFEGDGSVDIKAILLQIHTEGCRIENNIFDKVQQTCLNVGRQGANVFSYNYFPTPTNSGTALINDHGNHGAHPYFCLYEGNKMYGRHHQDSIHGSGSSGTIFRNWFRMRANYNTFGEGGIWLDSYNTLFNAVGNVLGYAGLTGATYEWESDGSMDDETLPAMPIWRFGVSGYNQYEVYPLAKSSTLRHGNVIYGTNTMDPNTPAIVWDEGIAEHNIPFSMYLSGKPDWWGDIPFPATGPDTSGYYTNVIPAEYRFLNNNQDPPRLGRRARVEGRVNLRGKAKLSSGQ